MKVTFFQLQKPFYQFLELLFAHVFFKNFEFGGHEFFRNDVLGFGAAGTAVVVFFGSGGGFIVHISCIQNFVDFT